MQLNPPLILRVFGRQKSIRHFWNTLYKPLRDTLFIQPHPAFAFYYFKPTPPTRFHPIFSFLFFSFSIFLNTYTALLLFFGMDLFLSSSSFSFHHFSNCLLLLNESSPCSTTQRIHSFFFDAHEDSTSCAWFMFFARFFSSIVVFRSFSNIIEYIVIFSSKIGAPIRKIVHFNFIQRVLEYFQM